MLKKFVAWTCTLLVGTVMVFGLTGCGGDTKPAAPANNPAPDHAAPADGKDAGK